jgi:antagonist of KipI
MISVIKAGLFTTIQDMGRSGYRRFGIPESGVMDKYNATLANWLVNNKAAAPILEITMSGPELIFTTSANIALTGADMSPDINGNILPLYQSTAVSEGDILSFGRLKAGCRTYLAVNGGFKAEFFINSYSTYTLAEKGGFEGRALKPGDNLQISESKKKSPVKRIIPEYIRTKFAAINRIRYIPGPEAGHIEDDSPGGLPGIYTVHPQSDRMGIRLAGFDGEVSDKEIVSSPVNKGTIQLLPDNNLIVLMNDGQVSGGYPRLGNVIGADLHLMAQLKPSDQVKLMPVTIEEAESLFSYQSDLLKKYRI